MEVNFDTFQCGSLKDRISAFHLQAKKTENKLSVNPFSDTYEKPGFKKGTDRYGRPPKGSLTEARGIKAGKYVFTEVLFLCEMIEKFATPNPANPQQRQIKFGEFFRIYSSYSDSILEFGVKKHRVRNQNYRKRRRWSDIYTNIMELCEMIDSCGSKRPDGLAVIRFGHIFRIYTRISDTVVGLLLRARKYGLVSFEGEMLYQRQDDHKIITLLMPFEEIKANMRPSGDPKSCIKWVNQDDPAEVDEPGEYIEVHGIYRFVKSKRVNDLPDPVNKADKPEDAESKETAKTIATKANEEKPPPGDSAADKKEQKSEVNYLDAETTEKAKNSDIKDSATSVKSAASEPKSGSPKTSPKVTKTKKVKKEATGTKVGTARKKGDNKTDERTPTDEEETSVTGQPKNEPEAKRSEPKPEQTLEPVVDFSKEEKPKEMPKAKDKSKLKKAKSSTHPERETASQKSPAKPRSKTPEKESKPKPENEEKQCEKMVNTDDSKERRKTQGSNHSDARQKTENEKLKSASEKTDITKKTDGKRGKVNFKRDPQKMTAKDKCKSQQKSPERNQESPKDSNEKDTSTFAPKPETVETDPEETAKETCSADKMQPNVDSETETAETEGIEIMTNVMSTVQTTILPNSKICDNPETNKENEDSEQERNEDESEYTEISVTIATSDNEDGPDSGYLSR